MVTKLKNLNCDNSKTLNKLKLKKKSKNQIVTKVKDSNCDKTQIMTKFKL